MAKIVIVHRNTEHQEIEIGDNDKIAWITLIDNKGEGIGYYPVNSSKGKVK